MEKPGRVTDVLPTAFVSLVLALLGTPARAQGPGGGDGSGIPGTEPVSNLERLSPPDPVLEDDCEEYIAAFLEALESGELGRVVDLVDCDAIAEKAAEGLELPEAKREGLRGRMARGIRDQDGFLAAMIKRAAKGGVFEGIRIRIPIGGGAASIILRELSADYELNYWELALRKDRELGVLATDIRPFALGEPLSLFLRRVHGAVIRGRDGFVADMARLARITRLLDEGRREEAAAEAKALRPDTRRERSAMLILLRLARSDEASYLAAFEEFRARFPDDPSLDLQALDYFTLKADYPAVFRCLDGLERAVGRDPYIDCLRSEMELRRGGLAAARACARRAIDYQPGFAQGHYALLAVALREEDFGEVLSLLKTLVESCGVKVDDLKADPTYAKFVGSPHYARWLEFLGARDGPAPDHGGR